MSEYLMTYAEVCERLRITKPTARQLVANGDLRIVRIGRAVRIRSSDVDRFVERGGEPDIYRGLS